MDLHVTQELGQNEAQNFVQDEKKANDMYAIQGVEADCDYSITDHVAGEGEELDNNESIM